jgi:hypothetical protein
MKGIMAPLKSGSDHEPVKLVLAGVVDTFLELYELLEEYAPAWYPAESHDRAERSLILLGAALGTDLMPKSSSKKRKPAKRPIHKNGNPASLRR